MGSKRQVPSWGITKADLMRMHGIEVDKLNARIKALESKVPLEKVGEYAKFVESTINFRITGMTDEMGSTPMGEHFEHLKIRVDEDRAILGVLQSWKPMISKTAREKVLVEVEATFKAIIESTFKMGVGQQGPAKRRLLLVARDNVLAVLKRETKA